jgi:membrane-associated phospholipid phosphatase
MRHHHHARTDEPLLAWPGIDNLRDTLPLCALFALIFYACYGGASIVTGFHDVRLRMHFDFEQHFPFVPAWALVYLSLNVLLALSPLILRTRQVFLPLFFTMSVETVLASLCFIFLPVADGYAPVLVSGFWGPVFSLADVVNLDHNYLPSLHVTLAVTAALAFGQRCGRGGKLVFHGWATAIALSTLFTHQHYLLDVLTGLVLALVAMRVVYPRATEAAFLANQIRLSHELMEHR